MMTKNNESVEENTPKTVELKRKRKQPIFQFSANPVYDLLLSLHVAFCPARKDDYDLDSNWIETALNKCSDMLKEDLFYYFGEDEGQWCAAKLTGIFWQAETESIPDTLDWFEQHAAITDIIETLLESDGIGTDWQIQANELIVRSLEYAAKPNTTEKNKQNLAKQISAFSKRFPSAERAGIVAMLTNPEQTRRKLAEILREWYRLVFAEEEPRLRTQLEKEVNRLKMLNQEVSHEQLFGSIIRGFIYDPPAAIERIVLVPSIMLSPAIFHMRVNDTLTYCYPLTVENLENLNEEDSQRHELAALFDALSDDTRLRILRLLSQRSMYLTELAEHLGLTKATTRHHMIRLRAAGVVTLLMREHYSYYFLRKDMLDSPSRLLRMFLQIAETEQ